MAERVCVKCGALLKVRHHFGKANQAHYEAALEEMRTNWDKLQPIERMVCNVFREHLHQRCVTCGYETVVPCDDQSGPLEMGIDPSRPPGYMPQPSTIVWF